MPPVSGIKLRMWFDVKVLNGELRYQNSLVGIRAVLRLYRINSFKYNALKVCAPVKGTSVSTTFSPYYEKNLLLVLQYYCP